MGFLNGERDKLVLLLCNYNPSRNKRTLIRDALVVVSVETCPSACQNGRCSPLDHLALVGINCLLQRGRLFVRSGGGGRNSGQDVG